MLKIDIGVSNRHFYDKILKKQSDIFNLLAEQNFSVSSLNFICQSDGTDGRDSNSEDFDINSIEKHSFEADKGKENFIKILRIIEHCLVT